MNFLNYICKFLVPTTRLMTMVLSNLNIVPLKGQTDEKLNFDECISIVISTFLTSLLLAKKYLRTFDVICADFLKGTNKECECSNQYAKNGAFNGLFLD